MLAPIVVAGSLLLAQDAPPSIVELERRVTEQLSAGEVDESLADTLHRLGFEYYRFGRFDEARATWDETLALRERLHGRFHGKVVDSLNHLARLLIDMGVYERAGELTERALAASREVRGENHASTAWSLDNRAYLLWTLGEYEESLPLFLRALELNRAVAGEDGEATALTHNNLSALYADMGDFASARRHCERALAIYEQLYGPEHRTVSTLLSNLATLLSDQGDDLAARPYYERSLAIAERTLGPDHPETALSLDGLGYLLFELGDHEAARPLLERALTIREQTFAAPHPSLAVSLDHMGHLLAEMGELVSARSYYDRALAMRDEALGPLHYETAVSLNNLAGLLYDQGDFEAALPYFERALEAHRESLGTEHPRTAKAFANLGSVHRRLGEPERGRPLLERAVATYEGTVGAAHPDLAEARNDLARLYVDLGEIEAAWEVTGRGQRAARGRIEGLLAGLSESESYHYLAQLRWQLELRLTLAERMDEVSARSQAYDELLDWKGQVGRFLAAGRERLAAGASAEERALLEELRACQARLSKLVLATSSEDGSGHERELDALRRERNRLEVALRRTWDTSVRAASFADLRVALPPGGAIVDLFAHRRYLPVRREGGAVLEGAGMGDPRVSAWIVRADRENPEWVTLGSVDACERAVSGHLRGMLDHDRGFARGVRIEPEEPAVSGDDAVRRLIWEPLTPFLQGIDTIFVAPDGALGTLPFETIQDDRGRYLVERYGFVYLTDAGTLAHVAAERRQRSVDPEASLLAVGGVDFDARGMPGAGGREGEVAEPGSSTASDGATASPSSAPSVVAALRAGRGALWPELPGTSTEARTIASMHGRAVEEAGRRTVLTGAAATEESLKRLLPRYDVLHIATHGFFHPEGVTSTWETARQRAEDPSHGTTVDADRLVGRHPGLLSGLVCAGANLPVGADAEDGYLTAEEVGWLDLSDVELVVLSACETGLGRQRSGEGMIGLRRAFRTAGAGTVVSSLWKVDDAATADFMGAFYESLWTGGRGRLEALRETQLAMLARNRERHGHALPSTWGAFVLSGEWR